MQVQLNEQPWKGLFVTFASVPVAVALWIVLIDLVGVGFGAGAVVFTVCFTYFWHLAWSFYGWPANRLFDSRWTVGTVNWLVLMGLVALTLGAWSLAYGRPFYETGVGLWAQTTIIAAVISLFFFGNQLLLPADLAEEAPQPLTGGLNVLWAVLFFPTVLFFVPPLIMDAGPLYLPWIWFPIALIPMAYFGGWPFDELGQPRAGIAYASVVFVLTFAMLGAFWVLDMGFFQGGARTAKAAIFGATWTNVGLLLAWAFNMWPIGTLSRPVKGVVGTVGTLAVAVPIHLALVSTFADALGMVVFAQFAYMWAQVSFEGPGTFDFYSWGYEDDPGGAGVDFDGRAEETPQPSD
jgi:hypothetical protein